MVNRMNCSYDSYRVFYYAAKYQNFTQAASVLFINQPNVTRTIKNLETALGCRLFFRSGHSVQLTPEGERLYAHVALAFEHFQAGEAEIAADRSLQSGVVTIAASEIGLHCCLLPVLKAYRAKYPGVRIRVSNYSSPQAVEAVKNGLADFAVAIMPQQLPKTLLCRKIMDIQERPIAGTAFAALRDKPLPLAELTRHPLVGLGPRTATFGFYSQLFSEHGLTYQPDIEAATAGQIVPLVKSGLGIGFVPESFALEEILAGHILALSLEEPTPKRPLFLLKRKEARLSIAAGELEGMIAGA